MGAYSQGTILVAPTLGPIDRLRCQPIKQDLRTPRESMQLNWEAGSTVICATMVDCISMRLIPVRLWALAILSGVLQVLPFPMAGPVPVWRTAFCLFALTPLLLALAGKDANGQPIRAIQGAALGYVSGFVWYLGNCYWVYETMHLYGALPSLRRPGFWFYSAFTSGLSCAIWGADYCVPASSYKGEKNWEYRGRFFLACLPGSRWS